MVAQQLENEERENKCYFCKIDLSKESKKNIIQMKCCETQAHKNELFQWYLRKPYCPSCLKEDKKTKKKIMDWGKKNLKK